MFLGWLLLRFALMAGSSSYLTGVDHSSTASSPLVFVLGIIDTEASLLYIFFTTSSHDFFSVFLCSYVLKLFLSLLF